MTDTAVFFRNGTAWTGVVHGSEKPYAVVTHKCSRCSGAGRIDAYRHVEGGVCFDCGGSGRGKTTHDRVYTANEIEKLNATAAKKAAKKAEKHAAAVAKANAEVEARREAFTAAHGAEVAWLEARATDEHGDIKEGFAGDMVRRARNNAEWTEAQAAAVARMIETAKVEEVKKAASHHVGKVGKRVDATVTVEREYGFERTGWRGGIEVVWITTMRDADGNAYVVKSSAFREAVGSTVHIRGTVKEHKEFRGERQTVLSRVTCKDVVKEAA